MAKDWIVLPAADLADSKNWKSRGGNQYETLRSRLLIVESDGSDKRYGPVVEVQKVPPSDTITLKWQQEEAIIHTDTIRESVLFTTTSRVCDRVASTIRSALELKAPGFSGKVETGISAIQEEELTQGLEHTLDGLSSYELMKKTGLEQTIVLPGHEVERTAEFRRAYTPKFWDIYLYSVEYLELKYRKRMILSDVRKTMKRVPPIILKWPLFRVVLYEPQETITVHYDDPPHALSDPPEIEVHSLTDPCPPSRPDPIESLDYLASLAFPTSRKERDAADRRKAAAKKKAPKRKAPRKKAVKRKAVKRKAVKRKAVKRKAVKRKAVKRKAPKKKAAKKKAAKRRAPKRKVAKRKVARRKGGQEIG